MKKEVLNKLGIGGLLCITMLLSGCMATSMKISSVTPPPQSVAPEKYKFHLTEVSVYMSGTHGDLLSTWGKCTDQNIFKSLYASKHPRLGGPGAIPLKIKIILKKMWHPDTNSFLNFIGAINLGIIIPMITVFEDQITVAYCIETSDTKYVGNGSTTSKMGLELMTSFTMREVEGITLNPIGGIVHLFTQQDNSFIHESNGASDFIYKKEFTDAVLQGLSQFSPQTLARFSKGR